jgi:drug/metabolite transporter (DMT)-like permease
MSDMVSLVVLSAIWGSSFALIKIAVDAGVGPVWVAFWRCLFGAATLLALCALRRERLPRDRTTWAHAGLVALLVNAAPFSLLSAGEQRVSSVLAGVLNAATPLTTSLFVLMLIPGERLSRRRLLGLAVGFAGVACVFGLWRGVSGGSGLGALLCLMATVCYGAGFTYTRRCYSGRPGSVVTLAAVQVTAASVQLAVLAPILDGAPTWPGLPSAAALVLLGAIGTGVAYFINLRIIRKAGAAVAATVTYLIPVWSTVLGAVLLAEPVGWNTVLGGLLVVAGITLTTHERARSRPTPAHR